MSVKLRLQRHGRKKYAYFHIVAADSRAPRNGRFIERLGLYNPNTNPATIELDFDKTLDWIQKGAQPTETMNAILAYKGVLLKNHLLGGVKKGALTMEQAEAKFAEWQQAKEAKINAKKGNLSEAKTNTLKDKMKAETDANLARAKKIDEKRLEAIRAAEKAAAPEVEETSSNTEDEAPEEKHS